MMKTDYTKNDLIQILSDNSQNEWLFQTADKIRKDYVGDEIHLRGLIEFSNICSKHCLYCGLRCENNKIKRYRIPKDELLIIVQNAVKMGYKTIVLQSGEDNYYSVEKLCEIISEIKKLNVAITLGLGEKTYEEYKAYKDAGADRYLLRIETTDEELYKKMHPKMSFKNRLNCLYNLKELGYEVGTGCLVGLPGQTIDSLANDILFFKELDADMIGIGPFIPSENTPLANAAADNFWLSIKTMALTRILLKNINIPATTAMETLTPNGRLIALQSGANVIMPNVTMEKYSENYKIYPNKIGINNNPELYRKNIEEKIKKIGRTISTDFGFRKK